MAIRRVTGAVSPSELIFADANALGATYDGSGTTIERGETFTLPAGGTTAVSNGALRLEALKGDCTITNNGNSTLTNASGVDGTILMRSGASEFPAYVKNSSLGSMSTPAREDFTGDVTGTINSNATFPAGIVLQVLQTFKSDTDSIAGVAQSNATGKNSYAFIPGQGTDAVFQQEITVTGSNKVLITHHGSYNASVALYKLNICLFRGPASDTAIGSCTKLGAGDGSSNPANQSEANASLAFDTASTETQVSFSFLDSPGAGTHYYKLAWLGENGATHYINRNHNDGNVAYHARTSSSLDVMEIKV